MSMACACRHYINLKMKLVRSALASLEMNRVLGACQDLWWTVWATAVMEQYLLVLGQLLIQ
ncbi:hypothetical protein HOLleu_07019 [Holothuria leucospilota]|uniref:Uncharacterized protein n=1 Tax=Holothuria leucospilota TaxID=206669 RepID=A0A9Q1CGQ6_HOLLE|nr:hypothetical protein HOLleu_07019 [Holothuria leucospilota]